MKDIFVSNVETVVPDGVFIYSRTDLRGIITEANDAFCQLSGYSVEEMLGKPHNIVRHPDMPQEAFADLWRAMKEGRPWQGLVKNRRKDGGFYWVIANASPIRENGRIVGYQSLRYKPSRELIRTVEPVYEKIQRGNSGLFVEDGYAFPVESVLVRFWKQPETQLTVMLSLAILASISGLIFAFTNVPHGPAKDFEISISLVSLAGCAYGLLRTMPEVRCHHYDIEKYLDVVLSQGDLTETDSLQRQLSTSRIARKLLQMTNWMRTTVLCIHDAVCSVDERAEEIRQGISEIEQAARSQNLATSSVAAATEELGLTIHEVAEHLQKTENSVSESGEQAASGALISQQANEKIRNLAALIRTASTGVETLGSSTIEVGTIASVIKEIADQTNLLALNASIEAARAGDAGLGFAVVANEVRRLADRTTQATNKIEALVSTITNDSKHAVSSMQAGVSEMGDSVSLVQKAEETLQEINEHMGNAVTKVSEIATASSQQTEAMKEISTNIAHVAAMSEQNVGVVQTATEKIGAMSPLVQRVVKAVCQYKV